MATFSDLIAEEEKKKKKPSQIAAQENKENATATTFADLIDQEQKQKEPQPITTPKPTAKPQPQQEQPNNFLQQAVSTITKAITSALSNFGTNTQVPLQNQSNDQSKISQTQPNEQDKQALGSSNTPQNTVSSPIPNRVPNLIDSLTSQYFPEAKKGIQDIINDPINLHADPKNILKDYVKGIQDSVVAAGTSLRQVFTNDTNIPPTPFERGSAGLQTVSRTVGAVFSPLTSLFTAAQDVQGSPGETFNVGTIAKVINVSFTALGEGGTDIANSLVGSMPDKYVSKEIKDQLRPGIGEIFALAAQLVAGKAGDIGIKKAELTKKFGEQDAQTIVNKAQELADEKKQQEANNTQNNVVLTPDQARTQVQATDLNGTQAGEALLQAADQAEKQNKSLVISDQKGTFNATTPQGTTFGIDLTEPVKYEPVDNNQKTIGQMQQETQNPDLTVYENAFNKGDSPTMDALAAKNPDDTRFQIHKNLSSQSDTSRPQTLFHGTNNTPDIINTEGLHLSRNASEQLGKAVYFTDSPATVVDHGANYVSIKGESFKLKSFKTLQEQQDYIKQQGTSNLADAIKKEGKYDGFTIPNPDPKVGTTVGIVNLDKVNSHIIGKNAAKPTPLDYKELSNQVANDTRLQDIAPKVEKRNAIIQGENGQKNRPSDNGGREVSNARNAGQERPTIQQASSEDTFQRNDKAVPGRAEQPAETKGTPSKIAGSIERKAIEAKLTKGFDGVAGYDKITIKDQAEKATKLMQDLEKARKVIRGEEPLPQGLKGTALITAAEEHIKNTKDAQMAYDLANSPLVSETSAAAQELRLAVEREPDSLAAQLSELKKAKQEGVKKRTGKDVKKAVKDTVEQIKKSKPKAKKEDWASFIESIQC